MCNSDLYTFLSVNAIFNRSIFFVLLFLNVYIYTRDEHLVAKSGLTLLWLHSQPSSPVHGFPREEYWSGLPFPSPGQLSSPGFKLTSPVAPALQEDSLPLSHLGSPYTVDTLQQLSAPALVSLVYNNVYCSYGFTSWDSLINRMLL